MKKNIDYLICIPIYKVTERVIKCVNSIKDNNVILIDNSGKKECEIFKKKHSFQIKYQKENIGIPRSWNIGLKEGHEWTFIVSSSMLFNKPFKHIIDMLNNFDDLIFRTNHYWHCIGINKQLVKQIGYFDENFYPGYYEDCDFEYRYKIFKEKYNYIEKHNYKNIDAICQLNGAAISEGLEINLYKLHNYFQKKWGGNKKLTIDENPEYKNPFNNPLNDLDYFEKNDIKTLKKIYNLK